MVEKEKQVQMDIARESGKPEAVIEKYKKIEANYDYVLVEGTDFSGEGGIIELDINLMIAKNLNIPALIVGSGNGKKKKDFINTMQLSYNSFISKEVDVIGIVANKIEEDEVDFSPRLLNKYTLNTTYSNSEISVELFDFKRSCASFKRPCFIWSTIFRQCNWQL